MDILHSKAPVTCLFGAVGWGADEAGHPFEEQTKKRPAKGALPVMGSSRRGCWRTVVNLSGRNPRAAGWLSLPFPTLRPLLTFRASSIQNRR